jgi:hypothetical protein
MGLIEKLKGRPKKEDRDGRDSGSSEGRERGGGSSSSQSEPGRASGTAASAPNAKVAKEEVD